MHSEKSWQQKVIKRLVEAMMAYQCSEGEHPFQDLFNNKVEFKPKLLRPETRYPAMFAFMGGFARDPFAIGRVSLWISETKIFFYTLTGKENDMDQHYLWTEMLGAVCDANKRLGRELGVHDVNLETVSYNFNFDGEHILSETDCTVAIKTKVCPARIIC